MAAEGQNKAASSLLDLQPTAVLELFRVYPDRINKPTLFMGFHGGSIFDKAIKWQGVQYIPLAIESEGFNVLGDGKMARPKIRVANKNNIITNLLQNYKDLIQAKIIRKKVQVKFLDDDNFDGGNPFGVADSKAELLSEEWIMGRKTQESKIFVEFELNSPLDLESFSVNARGIQARFCYWQYRGEGCRYEGFPVERENETPFQDANGDGVVPIYTPPPAPPTDPTDVNSQTDFFSDQSIVWNTNTEYSKGNIVVVKSPTILLPPQGDVNSEGVPLKTVYISVADSNVGKHPEKNPSFWQKDGCSKRFGACQKRFNSNEKVGFRGPTITSSFPSVRLSGMASPENSKITTNSGCFHTTEADVTGVLDPRKEWTLAGWVNINDNSPRGAGIFSTSPAEGGSFPASRFLNINRNSVWNHEDANKRIQLQYIGYSLNDSSNTPSTAFRYARLGFIQPAQQENEEWHHFAIRNSTGAKQFLDNDAALARDEEGGDTETFLTRLSYWINGRGWVIDETDEVDNIGNFASWADRVAGYPHNETLYPCLPQTFMIGAQEFWRQQGTWPDGTATNWPESTANLATMNGHIGMWGLWNRALNSEEIRYLRKQIPAPVGEVSPYDYAPRPYVECTGGMSTLTGGTGDGLPEDAAPLLWGSGTLVAWWSGTTGNIGSPSYPTGALLDGHTGGYHLTGSGSYSGVDQSYSFSSLTMVNNPTTPNPRFGGFPGTDGFNYGRDGTF